MSDTVKLLDLTKAVSPIDEPPIEFELILLDGNGGELPADAEPVWLEFPRDEPCKLNSRGELFGPLKSEEQK